jgi:hypothetical protein
MKKIAVVGTYSADALAGLLYVYLTKHIMNIKILL